MQFRDASKVIIMKRKTSVSILIVLLACAILAGCGNNVKEADSAGMPDTGNPEISDQNGEDAPEGEMDPKDGASDNRDEADPFKAEAGDGKEKAADSKEETSAEQSLAQRMAGKYSYHYRDDEYYIMDVVPFGDNLYAFCGTAISEDDTGLAAYSFWTSEFIPYDAKEMADTAGDTVTVNELCFSVMSNAGKYWNPGHQGSITLTDDGLVFQAFRMTISWCRRMTPAGSSLRMSGWRMHLYI